MSSQNPKLIFQGHPGVNTTELPSFTTKSQLLAWADTKGSIASIAELNDPQSILLRLDQGQLPQQPFWTQDSALKKCDFLWPIPQMWTLRSTMGCDLPQVT